MLYTYIVKKFLGGLVFVLSLSVSGELLAAEEYATRSDIRLVLERMDIKFEQVEKRFEQIDKRFEQVDNRFDQTMWFIGLWIPVSMAVVGYILQRLSKHDDHFISMGKREISAQDILVAIEKADSSTRKKLKIVLK